MAWYIWVLISALGFGAGCALYRLLNNARAKDEKLLTPEELKKKRALEDMADRLSP
jgi:hypothetical protein